ncbi:MAG: MBL fold metallo-hydrolase [Sphaerospermopsis sp. SIO1G2]|nr:MBL fold metallo-hydrolase [Sphaerospermopsis sp. SIO1G2]
MIQIKRLPLGPMQTNCYIVMCENTGHTAVIDPSWNGRAISAALIDGAHDITHILITHAHFDHVGGLAQLKDEFPEVPVYLHPEASEQLSQVATQAMFFGMKIVQPSPAEKELAEGDVIELGDLRLQVLYTPGHAQGHVSFYIPEVDVIFSGDVLFEGSIGRTDLPGADHETLINVITNKLMTLPDRTHVLSGHGNPTTIGQERHTNPFLQ